MSKFEGSIFGKDIFTYSSRGGRQYSPDEIGLYRILYANVCDKHFEAV